MTPHGLVTIARHPARIAPYRPLQLTPGLHLECRASRQDPRRLGLGTPGLSLDRSVRAHRQTPGPPSALRTTSSLNTILTWPLIHGAPIRKPSRGLVYILPSLFCCYAN
jgi:hypothetical protein